MRKMRIFQHGEYISMDFLKKKSEIISIQDTKIDDVNQLELDIPGKSKKYIHFTTSEPEENNAIKQELTLFLESILYNKAVPVSIHDGLKAMEVGYLILDRIKKQLITKEN
jgi:hypothetical protein